MLKELGRLAHLLATQDNACTSDPIFTVQRRERRIGADVHFFADGEVYVHHDSDREPVFDDQHPEEFKRFEEGLYPEGDSRWDWEQVGYVDDWVFVQAFLTREAAQEFRASQAHNLGTSRIYVESAHKNPEWRLIRRLLGGEIESKVAECKLEKYAAIKEMAKARKALIDAESRGDLNAWLAHDFENEREGLVKRLWDKSKELHARNLELEKTCKANELGWALSNELAEFAEARVRELEPELLLFEVNARKASARIADLESQLEAARSNGAQLSEELRAVGEELAAARVEQGLEAKVREVLGERWRMLKFKRLALSDKWVAHWDNPAPAPKATLKATAENLPALLRAILEVERGS